VTPLAVRTNPRDKVAVKQVAEGAVPEVVTQPSTLDKQYVPVCETELGLPPTQPDE